MLRTFVKGDMQRLIQIEGAVQVTPWGEEAFKLCFAADSKGWVVEVEGKVVGFILVSLKAEECHILNLCVDRAHQRQGLGKQLLSKALAHAKEQGFAVAYLEVRRSNAGAIALYQSMSFCLIGERKGYYSTVAGQEDALIFAKSLQAHVWK